MFVRTFAVVVVTLAFAACGPLPGYEACRDKSDCDDNQICVLTQGVSRCAFVGEGEGDAAEGEGEGDVGEGEGEGVVGEGEGEGDVGEGEGEGEGVAASVGVTGPSFAPIGVPFAVRFDNETAANDASCTARVDSGAALPVGAVVIASTGAHFVTVTCGGVTSNPVSLTAWSTSNFAATSPGRSGAPVTTTVTWSVDGGPGFDASHVVCAIHTHPTSSVHAPSDPADTVIHNGGSVAVLESSIVNATSCNHTSEPSILTRNVDITVLNVVPARPTIALSIAGTTLTATATTSGAESCTWHNVNAGFDVGANDARTSASQTQFAVHLSDVDVGAGPAAPFAVTCSNGATTSDASTSIVVHGAPVDDDDAALDGVNVNLGSIHFTSAVAIVDLEALTHVAGSLTVDTIDVAPTAFLAPSLERVTGIVSLDGANASTFAMALGTSGGPPLVVGALAVNADAIAAISAPTLTTIDGDLDLANDPNLALVDFASLRSVTGSFHVVLDALDCTQIASLYCALSTPRPSAIVQDSGGTDCTSAITATCP